MVFEPLQIKEISRGGASSRPCSHSRSTPFTKLRLTLGTKSVVLKGRVAHSRISEVDQEVVHVPNRHRVRRAVRTRTGRDFEFLETLKAHRSGV